MRRKTSSSVVHVRPYSRIPSIGSDASSAPKSAAKSEIEPDGSVASA